MLQKTFDLVRTQTLFAGVPMGSYAEGDAITFEMTEDEWAMVTGADGSVTRYKMNNRTATATIRLSYGSLANNVLDGFRKLDSATGLGVFPFVFIDPSSGTKIVASRAWVVRAPNLAIAANPGTREWTLHMVVDSRNDFGLPGVGAPILPG